LNDKPETVTSSSAATENGFLVEEAAAKYVQTNHTTTTKSIDNNSSSNLNLMKIMENQEPNLLLQNGHHQHHRDHKHCNTVVSPKSKISKISIADEINRTRVDDGQIHC
jgi:hypothetical protein